jgi:hypothetical protein
MLTNLWQCHLKLLALCPHYASLAFSSICVSRLSGWQATFGYGGDWAGDCTAFAREVAEGALAHLVGDEVERTHRRGRALEQRRDLMNAWAAYCERPPQADNVIPMERKPIPA